MHGFSLLINTPRFSVASAQLSFFLAFFWQLCCYGECGNGCNSAKNGNQHSHISYLSDKKRAPSVQICDRYADNTMTLYRLRSPSGCPPDYT